MPIGALWTSLLLTMGTLSCAQKMSPVEMYERLLDRNVPQDAVLQTAKMRRYPSEAYAYFLVRMSREAFDNSFPEGQFSGRDEGDSELVGLQAKHLFDDIFRITGDRLHLPSPVLFLTGQLPGRSIDIVRHDTSDTVVVWVKPGPSGSSVFSVEFH